MNGEIAVSKILRDNSDIVALVADRVYIDEAQQTKNLPFIILESRDVEPIDSKSGKAVNDVQIVGVFIYSTTHAQLRDISVMVREALDHMDEGVYNNIRIEECVYMGESGFSEKLENRNVYAKDQEYRLRVRRYGVSIDSEQVTIDSETITIDQE